MRTALVILFCLALALLAFAMLPTPAAAADIEKRLQTKPGGALDIELKAGGSIAIYGWDKDSVAVEVDFDYHGPEDYVFDIEPTRNGVAIFSKARRQLRKSHIEVTVNVPRQYDVKVATAGGRIDLQDLHGDFRGRSGGGEIELQNLEGTVKLTTGGGAVEVHDCKIDGKVTTGGGPVRVENVVGDFDARSGGGNVTFSNVKTPGREYPAGMVHIRNAGGRIKVDDAPEGADVSTGGGDIHIRDARKFLHAKTGGGDVVVRSASGQVDITTGAGDIEITVKKDDEYRDGDITLLTGHGDIYLTVPGSMSMDIDIELAFTKRSGKRYAIKSDFQIQEEVTEEWEYDQGSPRRYIYGTATLNGGKNRIRIRTTNGNVFLSKGP